MKKIMAWKLTVGSLALVLAGVIIWTPKESSMPRVGAILERKSVQVKHSLENQEHVSQSVQNPANASVAVRDVVAQAESAAEAGNWDQARALAEGLLKSNPQSEDGAMIMAAYEDQAGQHEKALSWYVKALLAEPTNRDLSDMTYEYIKANNLKFAEVNVDAIDSKELSGEAMRIGSMILFEAGKIKESIDLRLNYLSTKQTHFAQDYADLARYYKTTGLNEKALEYYRLSRDNRFNYPSEMPPEDDNVAFFKEYLNFLKEQNANEEISITQNRMAQYPEFKTILVKLSDAH